jgi:hypothetical protein
MPRADLQLWSNSPYLRFRAARKYARSGQKFSKRLVSKAPHGRWPFGMPTSINPWLLVMGISPGRGEHISDYGLPPSIGNVNSGFGGRYGDWDKEKPSPFWRKVRQLCFGLVKTADSRLGSESACLTISGMLNLGIKNEGQGTFDATNLRIVKWIPQALEMLKPRVIVLLGWKGFLRDLPKPWKKNAFLKMLVASQREDVELRIANNDHIFCVWRIPMSWGNVLVICWPNHPSRPPFGGMNNWEESVKRSS